MIVMELQKELSFFEKHRTEWLEHYSGKFALIKDNGLLGTYTTWDEAFTEGVSQLGNVPFLIKQVREEDESVQFPVLAVGALHAHP